VKFRSRGDWRIEGCDSGPRVVIPTRPIWPVALFMAFWLCGWAAGEVSALKTLFGSEPWFAKGFMLFWLCGWTVGGAFAIVMFLATSGLARENVWRDGPDLCVRWSVLGFGWTRRFAASEMGPLSAPASAQRRTGSGEGGGLVVADDEGPLRPMVGEEPGGAPFRSGEESDGVRFSCAGKEVSVGKGLDAGQAARLAEVMALQFGLRLGSGPSGV
jgi:hypothetical protein